MKQNGNEIVGDIIKVDSYTANWNQVRVHPLVYYRRYTQFSESLQTMKSLFAELDMGQYISIRFLDKQDVTEFHRIHHEYL